jgi:hypothetical protein
MNPDYKEELDRLLNTLGKEAETKEAITSLLLFSIKVLAVGYLLTILPRLDIWRAVMNFFL